MKFIRNSFFRFSVLAIFVCSFSFVAAAQSTDQNFPTAITTNEINGVIRARDVGDSRLTSHFYAFDGGQGDIFINVVTSNFNGDIDVFTSDGLRPLSKMVIYADGGGNETGRLIYLRKPERLILRVEGRSPNDDPSTYKIKFGGSFIALSEQNSQSAPVIKNTEVVAESGVRVNSVGTIVEVLPKPQPSIKATPVPGDKVAAVDKNKKGAPANKPLPSSTPKTEQKENETVAKVIEKKPKLPPNASSEKKVKKVEKEKVPPVITPAKKTESRDVKTVFRKKAKKQGVPPAERTSKAGSSNAPAKLNKPDPMANIRLVVQLKDGTVIERSMSEISTFKVDNGVLIVSAKNGSTVKYSMLDVAKVTIE